MKLAKNTLLTFLLVATLEAISLVIATTARAVPLPVTDTGIAPQQEVLPSAFELAPTAPIMPVDLRETPASQVAPITQIENPLAPAEPIELETPASQVAPTTPTEVITEPETTNATSPLEVKILNPTNAAVLDIAATSVILQYAEGSTVELKVNGVSADPSSIGRTETDNKSKIVTQTWYGVVFKPGDNTITAQATREGKTGEIATVKLQVRGTATQIKLQTTEARIPADGRSTATIEGQLLDAKGNRSQQSVVVTLVASAGEFVGADADRDRDGFQVKAEKGQFTAQLRSVLQAQTVQIAAIATNLEAFAQIQFETNLRPSLVTGVINLRLGKKGTDYYGSFRDFLPPDEDNKTQIDINSAVFATGRVGDWLFTGAYNSDRTLNEDCNGNSRLFRDTNDCTERYPVYGDSSTVEATTPSQDQYFSVKPKTGRVKVVPKSVRPFNAIQEIFVAHTGN